MEDMAARIGGEEFAILLPDTSLEKAVLVAERIQNELRRTDAGPLPLTVSIGIAAAIPHAESWERLVSRADKAMYEAKRTGKNRIVVSDGYQVPVAGRVP
jgi:diguanylate cyclase (GGDEF)-like protein